MKLATFFHSSEAKLSLLEVGILSNCLHMRQSEIFNEGKLYPTSVS